MKAVLVTHDSAYGRFLAHALQEAVGLDRIIIEQHKAPLRFYWRKFRRVGPHNAAFQFWLNRWYQREGAKALPGVVLPPHEGVSSVNALTFGADELIIGFGTSYVTRRTLANAPHGILNLHTGMLPQYRGVKSEFWAQLRGDPAGLGWTLHYMSPQLDAGDIVLQHGVRWNGENPATLRAAILRDAVPYLCALILDVRSHGFQSLPARPQGQDGTYYTSPTVRDWLHFKRQLRHRAGTV